MWNSEDGVRFYVNGELVFEGDELTAQKVKTIARQNGISTFVVKKDGEELNESDFPIEEGDVYLEKYVKVGA